MANKKQIAQRKQELVAQLSDSRQAITRGRETLQKSLKQKLQVKPLLHKLFTRKPKSLFAGSAVVGLATALFLRRPRKIKKVPQSRNLILLGWILSIMKPAAKAWLITRAKEAATQPTVVQSAAPHRQS
jgi:hypothetical protein